MPEVSIVLPTYNGERYIRESIESILDQTFTDWELIIVNDCSTDATSDIIKEYTAKDKRIKIIHNKTNQKLPASLNIGFVKAEGEYLTWTSDDNIYFNNAIERMVSVLKDNIEYEMVCADMRWIDEYGTVLKNEELYYDDKMQCFRNLVGACFMYKRAVIEQVGEYDTDLPLVEDYDYWLRIKKLFGVIHRIPCVLYDYRTHFGSLTETKRQEVQKQLMRMRKKHIDFILLELADKKEYIFQIYLEFIRNSTAIDDIEEKIFRIMPELAREKRTVDENKDYMIFGAGKIGEKAYEILQEKAQLFVDNNIEKSGTMKCGLPIISYQEMLKYVGRHNVMLAVSDEFADEIKTQLDKDNIINYCTYQFYTLMKPMDM